MGQVFAAGEVLHPQALPAVRHVIGPVRARADRAERIADDLASAGVSASPGNEVRMGIELDSVLSTCRVLHPQAPSE
jgi:hypothetical protein